MNAIAKFAVVTLATVLIGCAETSPSQQQLIPAVIRHDHKAIEQLLTDTKHVNINWRAGGTANALDAAVSQHYVDTVQLLLKSGADPNISTTSGTPLHTAAYRGYTDIAQILIDRGANVNSVESHYGYTPLISAARSGNSNIVLLLLMAGANPNAKVKDGRTAADLAEHYGHFGTADLIRLYRPRPAATGRPDPR